MYPTQFEITPRFGLGCTIYEVKESEGIWHFCNDGNARFRIGLEMINKRPMTEEEIEKARVIAIEEVKKRDAELIKLEQSIRETHENMLRMNTY